MDNAVQTQFTNISAHPLCSHPSLLNDNVDSFRQTNNLYLGLGVTQHEMSFRSGKRQFWH